MELYVISNMSKLRELCINRSYCDMMTNEEYSELLDGFKGHSFNIVKEANEYQDFIISTAKKICYRTSGDVDIENVIGGIFAQCFSRYCD